MTTEALQQAATEAPQAAPQAPAEAADTGSDADRFAAAVALLEAEGAPEQPTEAAPATPPAEAKTEPKAEPPKTEPEKVPTLAELEAEVAARRQAKGAEQPKPPANQPTQEQVAQAAKTPQEAAAIRAIPVDAFLADPMSAMSAHGVNPREVLQTLARATFGAQQQGKQPQTPTPADIDAKVEELVAQRFEQKWREAEEKREAARIAEQEAAAIEQTEQRFVELTNDEGKYSHLSRLGVEERIWYGDRIAAQYIEAGRQPTLEQIAATVEQYLAEKFGSPVSPGGGVNHQSAAGSETPPAPNGATTLSQDLPAQPSTTREPQTEEERVAAAIRVAMAGD